MSASLPEFIADIGDSVVATSLGVPLRTVQSWRRRERIPRPMQAKALIEFSAGRLTYESVYANGGPRSGAEPQTDGESDADPDADRIDPNVEGA